MRKDHAVLVIPQEHAAGTPNRLMPRQSAIRRLVATGETPVNALYDAENVGIAQSVHSGPTLQGSMS